MAWTTQELNDMKKKELQDILRASNAKISGTKSELVDRVLLCHPCMEGDDFEMVFHLMSLKCLGCEEGQPNQQAHMGVGGCLAEEDTWGEDV